MKIFLLSILLFSVLVSSAQVSTTQRHLYSDSVYFGHEQTMTLENHVFEISRLGTADDSSKIFDLYDTTKKHHFIVKVDSVTTVYSRYLFGYSKPFMLYVYKASLEGFGPIVFTALFYPEPASLIHSISFGVKENYINFKLEYTKEELKAGKLLPNHNR